MSKLDDKAVHLIDDANRIVGREALIIRDNYVRSPLYGKDNTQCIHIENTMTPEELEIFKTAMGFNW